MSSPVPAQNADKETSLKAVFLYNFTKYVEWENPNNGQFVIGVVGTSGVVPALIQISKSHHVSGRKIVIMNFKKVKNL